MATALVGLANFTIATPASTVTFSNIPNTYRDLYLTVYNLAGVANTIGIRFNGDTANNYTSNQAYYNSSGPSASNATLSYIYLNQNSGAGTTGGTSSVIEAHIFDANTVTSPATHTCLFRSGNDSATTFGYGSWNSGAAITSLAVISPIPQNFTVGSTFNLYGVLA